MSASNSASDSKGTMLIFNLKVLIIGYDVTINYRLHLELSFQKMDLEMPEFELGTFQFQTRFFTTVLTYIFSDYLFVYS